MADVEPKPTEQPPEEVETPGEATEEVPPAGDGGETPEAEVEEPAGEEGEEEEGAEPGEDSEVEAAGEESEPKQKRKRGGAWQRKIAWLEREKAQKERENAVLIEQLAHARGKPADGAEPDKAKTAEAQAAEYFDSLLDQRLAKRDQERQQQTVLTEFQRRTAEVRAATPDYDDVIDSAAHLPASPALQQALLTSEHGPAIMYQLAKKPAELARLSALPLLDVGREIGRLEAKFASSTPPPKTAPRRPAAPAPITPVTARGPTTVKRTEDMNYEEYNAWRDSQSKR